MSVHHEHFELLALRARPVQTRDERLWREHFNALQRARACSSEVELGAHNAEVAGSTPAGPTN
jgi:hypothetical protein